eukprot:1854641-Alexandrium_andersonii.AAC.1
MSASLVGSEMCIRDRFRAARGRHWRRTSRRKAQQGPERGERSLRTARTVSYTHLTLPTICSV